MTRCSSLITTRRWYSLHTPVTLIHIWLALSLSSSTYVASQTQVAASAPAGTSATSTSGASGSNSDGSQQTHSSNGAAIGGAIGGVIGGIILLGLLGYFWWRRRHNNNNSTGGVGGNGWTIDENAHDDPNKPGPGAGPQMGMLAGTATLPGSPFPAGGIQHSLSSNTGSPAVSMSTLPTSTSAEGAALLSRLPVIRSDDLQTPQSIALILQQQREIMELLQRQQGVASGSSQAGSSDVVSSGSASHFSPLSEKAQIAQQQQRRSQAPAPVRSPLPLLPPGAAPPRTATTSPSVTDPHADMVSPPPPPAYTPG